MCAAHKAAAFPDRHNILEFELTILSHLACAVAYDLALIRK